MKRELMNNILQGMLGTQNNAQMKRLQLVLEAELDRCFEYDDIQDTSQMDETSVSYVDEEGSTLIVAESQTKYEQK